MTDRAPPPTVAPPSQPTALSASSAPSSRDVARKQEPAEEEPYTIKCICDFPDDDGNTIYCDTCDTWQHIECYYPDNVEDALAEGFTHQCTDCEPRYVDREQAVARLRARTVVAPVEAAAEKKAKRPPSSKNQKKKTKPSDLHINGNYGSTDVAKHHSPNDSNPHPPKKAKSSHKPSHSISSQAGKRAANSNHGVAKTTNGHPLSPATTPPDVTDDFELHNYSASFLSLYNDRSYQIVDTNSFADIRVSFTLTKWLRDEEQMQVETGGLSYADVFQKLPANMDKIRVAPEIEQVRKVISPNMVVQWPCLRAPSKIEKDVPLIEVNGQIGFQIDYCADPANRWNDLTTPLPFVFFHPLLPLYIDTRREGSEARFVRRSCRPNAILETYLSSDNEYRFWLVSDRQIAAKEQITIPWHFGFPAAEKARALQLFGLGDDGSDAAAEQPVATDEEYEKWSPWVHLILSEYGGCACDLGPECAFARFRRNYLTSKSGSRAAANAPKAAGKKRKPKTQSQSAISPTSTGHATNSRAASEGHLEDVAENDRRSVSSAPRSKPPSRDQTPRARQGSFDTLGILTEPTDRDKRKVAMVEDTFRRMELQQQHPPRKRKRVSDGSGPAQSSKTSKPNSLSNTPHLSAGGFERGYVDAGTGTSRGKSGSPSRASPVRGTDKASRSRAHPAQSSHLPAPQRVEYCDAAVQTDFPDEEEEETPTPRRKLGCPLRKRLLESSHHRRLEEERNKRRALERPSSAATTASSHTDGDASSLTSPTSTRDPAAAVDSSLSSPQDHPMPDARPLPSETPVPISKKSLDLRVEPPPVPLFSSSAPPSASTPNSAATTTTQSPFSAGAAVPLPSPLAPPATNGAATPSPVKKKLSLSDYKSRMNKANAARPGLGGAGALPKPTSALAEEPKSAGGEVVDSPTVEKGDVIGAAATTSTTIHEAAAPSVSTGAQQQAAE
ncbi:hypothetical protein VTJ04DRAFT_4450 [Mycothermus thermophilus]|uniref:uncharacterized protein n=1 Tax=Humicola insolens TaxID=85995 RepID=UPI00374364B9